MKRVLVVEDEVSIREFIAINLKRAGYNVVEAGDGQEGLNLFEENNGNFDLAILDISMPIMDGLTLCQELRKRSSVIGIIMLTARTQEMDKVTGLLVGADDYVTKPFSPSELMARVDAIYRRIEVTARSLKNQMQNETIELGEFILNFRNHSLTKNDVFIELTQVEFMLLEYFFTNANIAIDRTDILNRVWGKEYVGQEKKVDVNIRRLRMKVETNPSAPEHLITVWGVGYKWSTGEDNQTGEDVKVKNTEE